MENVILKGKSINGISQTRCPYEYSNGTDVRIGSTWCKECTNFVSYNSTKKEEDSLIGVYDITVECCTSRR